MQHLSPKQLAEWLSDPARPNPVLLDVREPWEFEICRIGDPVHIPMNSVPERQAELDPGADIVLVCHHGGRSMQVAMFLESSGFGRLFNLSGGVDGWAKQVEPGMPQY